MAFMASVGKLVTETLGINSKGAEDRYTAFPGYHSIQDGALSYKLVYKPH